MAPFAEVVKLAQEMRYHVRKRAGLEVDWDKASSEMRDWYYMLARRVLDEGKT